MKLQTQIPLNKKTENLIDYNSKLLLLGSCFSENIGHKLQYFKFQTCQNPFGILFHPKAIETFIKNVIDKKMFTEKDIIFQNERWHCFDAHSSVSSTAKNEVLNTLNTHVLTTNKKLKKASHLLITLGTGWVYRLIETNKIVANCHKIPQKKFSKELLSVDEITESLKTISTLIRSVNKNVQVVFTVSPVRHLKDGFTENAQSKAHLIAAIHQHINRAQRNSSYFSSYEIMMDELRDYRFYAEDMIHPNTTAINYIWEKLVSTWFSNEASKTMKEIDVIQRGILHRSFNEKSSEHQQFLEKLAVKKKNIQQQFPFINF
ncbi:MULTISPECIES: GSCFA domain-containing protein [unclassified Polaribacter]|uniref:GSCFA domain-containing protein n=1 Tax=unclassified Polaribacter TaxID=196858 RepID=UPI0011BD55CE|nr:MULTISPECIES: GSCFA domain-containing protein [unclassified Polaribacter]TXD52661.1 GSCFA domain-containing protein [Polaribacter sp. IC063]TXD60630.1 GSCFA domain-containing protein [Polaribacter sp. IC066]